VKVAFLSESPSDEAALHVLVEGVLGEKVQAIRPSLRARGWPNVIQVLPGVISHLQLRSDADALVVVVDSDDTQLHQVDHLVAAERTSSCRLCQLLDVADKTLKRVVRKSARAPIHLAMGLAVPALEAWYLSGKDSEVSEHNWQRIQEGKDHYYDRKELKRRVYQTIRPTLSQQTGRAIEETTRLKKGQMRVLEENFPLGFGNLARMIRAWRLPPQGTKNIRGL
jgi:hypothetical protein